MVETSLDTCILFPKHQQHHRGYAPTTTGHTTLSFSSYPRAICEQFVSHEPASSTETCPMNLVHECHYRQSLPQDGTRCDAASS